MDLKLLRRLAAEVDAEHREAMRTFTDDFAARLGVADDAQRASRRSFLRRASGLLVGAAAAGTATVAVAGRAVAQESTTTMAEGDATTTTTAPASLSAEEIELASFLQSVELAAVEAYGLVAAMSFVPDEVRGVVLAFQQHHRDHAQAIAGQAGKAALGLPNATLLEAVGPTLEAASDLAAVAELAASLEISAAATYLAALGEIRTADPIDLIASILPIEMRHAVVWQEAAGVAVVAGLPAFLDAEAALTLADYPIQQEP